MSVRLFEPVDLLLAEIQGDKPLPDLGYALRRHIAGRSDQARRDVEAVEDVALLVAEDFLDLADRLALRVDDLPARLDQEPRDRIAQTDRPSTYQTGPCVWTGFVSESTRRIRSSPRMCSSSTRSRQRRVIPGEAP